MIYHPSQFHFGRFQFHVFTLVYLFHFGPLINTSATLGEVLTACKSSEHMDDKNGRPIGWAALAVHVDDCPGVGSSDRIIDYIKAGIMVQYESSRTKLTNQMYTDILSFYLKEARRH